MQVHITKADITNLPVDAIVNPANTDGTMRAGVAAALSKQGGPEIEREATASAPIAIGAAVVTSAGNLPAQKIIHVPTVEKAGDKASIENVRRAIRAALIAANAIQMRVLAVPGMGAGSGGVPYDEAARSIVEELRAHKKSFPETVYLVDVSSEMIYAFEDALDLASP